MTNRPLPPGCTDRDFTGASAEALLDLLAAVDAQELKNALAVYVSVNGATYNQRAMLTAACLDTLFADARPDHAARVAAEE